MLNIGAMTKQRFRVLVVGVGSIGERHVRCFLQTERCDVSICEVNSAIRETVALRHAIKHQFADVEKALANSYDAAVVAVPAHLHVPIAKVAADSGTHVLIEKPLSVSFDGVQALRQAVERASVVAAVAYVQRAHPAISAMRDMLSERRFGRSLQLVVVSGQHFPKYRPDYLRTYYADRAMGGGAIQDALTHSFDMAQWLVGPIDRLIADAAHVSLEGTAVEDVVQVLARHGNVLASYSVNQFQPNNEKTVSVICERGTARFEYHRNRWRWMCEPDEPWHDETFDGLKRDTLFLRQAHSFLDALEHGSPPLCPLDDGILALKANLAALESAKTKQWLDVSSAGASLRSISGGGKEV
ncbi:MAG: Gfo/Idh/MocA family oxidoreductase [Pirellulales bacterium]